VRKPSSTPRSEEAPTIASFALDKGKWDGIYVGRRKGDDLIHVGKVDHGFDKASAADLQKRLKPLIRKAQPYAILLDGPRDGPEFEAYVAQVHVPALRPGDIVVMDNLAAHKRAEGRHRNRRGRRPAPLPQSDRNGLHQAQGRPSKGGRQINRGFGQRYRRRPGRLYV
jgi:hypothetical protein